MEGEADKKRKKDRHGDDEDYRKEKKSKRARTRSRSPKEPRERDSRRKRRHSSSKSPERSVKKERQRDDPSNENDVKKTEAPKRKNKETDMLNTRTGGAYIPPARLRMMQAQITDKSSVAFQRLAWEALKKSIHGHINKVNVGNIGIIIKQLLKENIVRGRGLLCRSVIQAQAASPTFTNVYAALVAAVNSRFPNIGELLLKRLVIQFKRGFKRNDKAICISSASFIAHLVNQRVAHEILALELLTLLVETPTDDSVEVAIAFLKECGQKLTEVSSKGVNAIFEMLRNILHEGQLDKRVQYMIEVMFQVWKDGFKDHPALLEELELVPEEEQFTHLLMLDDATDPQDILNVFKFDDKYEENEQKYTTLSKEILGSDAESDGEGSGESGSEESDDEEGEVTEVEQKGMTIIDNTETNLVALRRTIYLTINSSLDFEECAHKLMKMQLKPGQEVELCHMFLDCCAEQRTYEKFYGLLAQRFCNINRMYIAPFEQIFKDSYSTAHRLDTNRLRNVSKFFAHLLFTDSIGWEVFECVKLNEEDTTSSSRIYIKILFQELAEYMGLKKLNDRLKDPLMQEAYSGVFPRDNPKNTRFSINFFTSIGLGGLTDELREHLKQMPKNVLPQNVEINVDSSSDSSSSSSSSDDSSSSSSDSSSSDSQDENGKNKGEKSKKKKKNKDKTPKTPEETAPEKEKERWGHDGFYDTYGKDARRIDSRPERNARDKDNFAIPRDVRRNDNSGKGDFRSQDNLKAGERNKERPEERRDSRDHDDRRRERKDSNGASNYRRDDDRRRERSDNDRNRDRTDDERRKERNYDERRDRNDERRDRNDDRRGDDDDLRRKDRNVDDTRGNDDDYRRKRNVDDRHDKSDRGRRDRDNDRYNNIPRKDEESEESRNRRERDYRGRDDEFRRDDCDHSRKNNDRDRSRKNREVPDENSSSRDKNHEEVYRNTKYDSKNRKNDKESSESEQDKRKSDKIRQKDISQTSEEGDRIRKNNKKKDSKRDAEDGEHIKKKNNKDKSGKHIEVDSSNSDTEAQEYNKKNKKNKKSKHTEIVSSETDSEDKNHSNKKKKKKSKTRKHKDDSSADEENQEKENKHTRDSSRDDDDERSRKRDKGKKKSADDEGWDIRRESSLHREMPDRYWKN